MSSTPPDTSSYVVSVLHFVSVLTDMEIDSPLRCAPETHPPITVVRTAEGVYAIDDTCTHQDTSLADGWVEDCAIECPLHETCFDLRTGMPTGPPATRPVATHPVSVVDGAVYVMLDVPTAADGSTSISQDGSDAA